MEGTMNPNNFPGGGGDIPSNVFATPDWDSAFNIVAPVGEEIQSGKGNSPQEQQQQCPTILEGSSSSIGTNNRAFKEAMELLIEMHLLFGSSVTSEEIRRLVDAFAAKIIQLYTRKFAESKEPLFRMVDLSCPICFEVLEEPHTFWCGHSYCKRCLLKEVPGNQCRLCSYCFTTIELTDPKPNVFIMGIADKLWPNHLKTAAVRNEATILLKQHKHEEALQKYTEALQINPEDHWALSDRAFTLWRLGQYRLALDNVQKAIELCPFCVKNYLRKAGILDSLGRYEEAFFTLSVCVYVIKLIKSPEDAPMALVKNEMVKALVKLITSALAVTQRWQRKMGTETNTPHSYEPYPGASKKSSRMKHSQQNFTIEEPDFSHQSYGLYGDPAYTTLPNLTSRSSTTKEHQMDIDSVIARANQIVTHALQRVADFENRRLSNLRQIDPSLISASDFECSLCYRLLFQPVTTICGHTYCRSCLERCLDHSPTCPLCKTPLDSCLAYRRYAITYSIEQLVSRLFPKEHIDRVSQHMEELTDVCSNAKSKELEIPIFVCTMAFPTVPCMLHVFEPRYRLMLRRCMESGSKRFGMCSYLQDGDHNYGDFGTMLEIRNTQYFPDGRSIIHTVGTRRFRVIKKCLKDGYNLATIEYLEDKPIEEAGRSRLRESHENVFTHANAWLESIDDVTKQRIITYFGNMPSPEEDWMDIPGGPSWTWWLLAILPLDAKAQLAVLGMSSLQKRLDSLQKVLHHVKTRLR